MSKYTAHLLKDLSLDDLIEAYHRACVFEKRLKTPDSAVRFAFGEDADICLQHITIDKAHLWQAMITKIPASHILEIENLKTQMALGTTDSPKFPVEAGQRWEHKHNPGMILQVDTRNAESLYWSCGLFFNNRYLMLCHVSSMCIIKHYNKLNP